MTRVPDQEADPTSLRLTQIIVMTSLPVGVSLFAAVTHLLRRGEPAVSISPLLKIWALGTILSLVAAFVAWGRLVRPHLDPSSPARLSTGLIICMALIEGMSLFGVLTYLIGGGPLPALASVTMIWLALVIFWPRADWYH